MLNRNVSVYFVILLAFCVGRNWYLIWYVLYKSFWLLTHCPSHPTFPLVFFSLDFCGAQIMGYESNIHIGLYLLTGWGEGILWCAWSRRKLCWRCASWDDGAECDRMRWWFPNHHLQWPDLTLSHPLWPEVKCFSISRARLHYRREASEEKAWTQSLFQTLARFGFPFAIT